MNEKLKRAIYGIEEFWPQYSLRLFLTKGIKISLLFIPLTIIYASIINPYQTFLGLFYFLNCLYLISQIFKLLLVIIGYFNKDVPNINPPKSLSIYTILLPLYKEEKVLHNLIKSIQAIDYPPHLLDVKLLIEEDDLLTLSALEKINLPDYFDVIHIPNSHPRTKPKACNYGLQFAKGKYIVIYDAEDKPDPSQLKQVVAKFATSDKKTICIQARLNYYNREENQLTKLFSIEYAIWFNYMLPALQKLSMPIPLGGTSNHFIREKLEELGGWDAFNVTEDADLGIRLYNQGYKTELINSETLEEAPITLHAWLFQRARWIKGHMLTSLLHLKQFYKLKPIEIVGITFFLYIPNLIYILLPFYLTLGCFVIDLKKHDFFWQSNLLMGIILPIIYCFIVIKNKKWHNMKFSAILSILYYWLLPIAGIRSCWQIFTSPFHWDKTDHGITKHRNET
jgi:cellulose synthase/poly-beta-1,6-N-acetylglucosamine synthase-like glycosyltransferase